MKHLNIKKWAKLMLQGYTDKRARELATTEDREQNKQEVK
jgi:hypothetical protein